MSANKTNVFNLPNPIQCRLKRTVLMSSLLLLVVIGAQSNAATPAKPNGVKSDAAMSDLKLQVLKDCKLLSERPLTTKEALIYRELKTAEATMEQLHQPLKQVEQQLSQQSQEIEKLSRQIEQTVTTDGRPDQQLIKQQNLLAEKIHQFSAQHEPDFNALSDQGHYIGTVADTFHKQIVQGIPADSFDQLRVLAKDEATPTTCTSGIFFSKSFDI